MKTIKEYLKEGMHKAKTHSALGLQIGCSQQSATRFLQGTRQPSIAIAKKLAQYIGEKETPVVFATLLTKALKGNDAEAKKFLLSLKKHFKKG